VSRLASLSEHTSRTGNLRWSEMGKGGDFGGYARYLDLVNVVLLHWLQLFTRDTKCS